MEEDRADALKLYMSSRRTIMSGEVVTFATGFHEHEGEWGPRCDATGPFEVSASRDAVIVHRAECRSLQQMTALIKALTLAEKARITLAPTWRGGAESKYPSLPTVCP
jgi:hypothetical protein